MPTIEHSFNCQQGDPFNNLTMTVREDWVKIGVHEYERTSDITLSREDAKRLALTILKELKEGEEEIIGYLPGGKRIGHCRPDRIYTAAIVSCCACHVVIRGAGGPMHAAMCPTCWEAK